MGGLWSIISSLLGSGLTFCKKINISKNKCVCCSNTDEEFSMQKNTEDMPTNNYILFDNYYLSNHYVTKQYYTKNNVAYFTTDTNGVAINVTDNMEEFIGISKEQNLQSISWVSNIASDNYETYKSWLNKAKMQKSYVKKMHFRFKITDANKKYSMTDRYVIVEAHPYYDKDDDSYLGLKGIVLNLPNNIWNMFNEDDFERYHSNFINDAGHDSSMRYDDNKTRHNSPRRQECSSPRRQEYSSPRRQEYNSPRRQEYGSPRRQEYNSSHQEYDFFHQEYNSPRHQEHNSSHQEYNSPKRQEHNSPRRQEYDSYQEHDSQQYNYRRSPMRTRHRDLSTENNEYQHTSYNSDSDRCTSPIRTKSRDSFAENNEYHYTSYNNSDRCASPMRNRYDTQQNHIPDKKHEYIINYDSHSADEAEPSHNYKGRTYCAIKSRSIDQDTKYNTKFSPRRNALKNAYKKKMQNDKCHSNADSVHVVDNKSQ